MKTIREILDDAIDDMDDDVLYSLSELNLLDHSDPNELDMTAVEIEKAMLKNKEIIDKIRNEQGRLNEWRKKIGETDGEQYKEEIFKELPYIKDRYERIKAREENSNNIE